MITTRTQTSSNPRGMGPSNRPAERAGTGSSICLAATTDVLDMALNSMVRWRLR